MLRASFSGSLSLCREEGIIALFLRYGNFFSGGGLSIRSPHGRQIMKYTAIHDTISAISTPQGEGAIGIVRLSGPEAIAIADRIFFGKRLSEQAGHTLHFGSIRKEGKILDEVVVGLFRAPHSYTGEDVVEISCHASPYIMQTLLQLTFEKGARPAKPGEFTLRAFLNGKMDLSQAEAMNWP